ncbi:M48 family metallopeptidase [Jeotgalibacillus haloalkalitolerans]|uniref:M48 family metallopeptidase n=1 Tax=Jeotgalibacillus haloalkalitolerans TaxID=3104292 RepID=A0ABU5KNL1_9BACL|nr:M48 family metallopeptidase [Jeotgalibacillus sp. HH7-29]MDZ5712848.1 M48 family metallopeptidase [Jeotgalibacillus sp. HH7-29]
MNHQGIKSERETVYFVLSAIFSVLIYIMAAVSIIGIGIALAVLAVVLFTNALMLGSIRGNGVRVSEKQFSDVYERTVVLSKEMGLKKVPDFFVIQSEGALNAFATRFFGRNMIVVYSEVFELARQNGQEELDFIIAHELAHIKRNHVWKNILVLPAQFIPFLSQAYSRSCEYTCDRHAAYQVGNADAAKRALTLLGVGKVMYREVNEDAYLEQIHSESNGAVWLSEVLSTHPLLPKRILSVERFMNPSTPYTYSQQPGRIVVGAGLLFGGLAGAYIAVIVSMTLAGVVFASILPDDLSAADDAFYEDTYETDFETTPLMDAVNMGDVDEVLTLIDNGADLEATDYEGSTALMYAIYNSNPEMLEILLEAGADPNTQDDYSTPLIIAINLDDRESAALLVEYGADPFMADADGDTPVDYISTEMGEDFYTWIEE